MDQSVLDALKRWPNVPAVYGWLSLSARGEWRLHPLGDAQNGGPGEGITNPQILGFMGRNYTKEPDGKWFFQNGPQRVYVRLDAAPYVAHLEPDSGSLITHNGLMIERVYAWFTDETGQLYAETELGAVRIDDRDLLTLVQVLETSDGLNFLEALETAALETAALDTESTPPILLVSEPGGHYNALKTPVFCYRILQQAIPERLGFIKNPQAETIAPQVS